MPRTPGSLNERTIDQMVANGVVCRLRDRLNCVKCRAARQGEEAAAVRTQVQAATGTPEMAVLFPAKPGAKTAALPPAEAAMVDTFLEYRAPDGKEWRAERGADLVRDFDILPSQLRQWMGVWHQAMAAQENLWLILRRLYGIAPMLGVADPDDMRVWTVHELGEKLGLDDDHIDALVGEAKLYFARYRASAQKERSALKPEQGRPMTAEEIQDMLERYDMEVQGDAERRYAAKRCLDLQPWLEHETGRPMARSAINQELLILYTIDRRIADLQAILAQKKKRERDEKITGTVNDDLENKRLIELMDARNKAVKGYEESMTKLGATQVQTGSVTKRQNFQLCVGKMVEALQLYYANADNTLIDGFATEAEIIIAATETDIRPAQYRGDVAIAWVEAMDNLWKPDYEQKPIGRDRTRKLRSTIILAVKGVLAEKDADQAPVDLAAEEIVDDLAGSIAQVSAAPAGLGESSPNPMMPMAPLPPRRGGDDNDVAVF